MPNSSPGKQRRKERRAAARASRLTSVATVPIVAEIPPTKPTIEHVSILQSAMMENQEQDTKRPPETKADGDQKEDRISVVITWIIRFLAASVGVAAIVNHFSGTARILYVSAITIVVWIWWESRHKSRKLRMWLIPLYILILVGAHLYNEVENSREPKSAITLSPVISPNRIQLGDGNRSRESLIDIFNPNDFPLYCTTIMIATIRTSDDQTLSFPPENVPESEQVMSAQGSVNWFQLEYNNRATNWHFVMFLKMSPKTHRPLRIRGSAGNPNWSELSVIDYRKEYSLSHEGANDTQWDAPPADSKIWKYTPSWMPRTNLSIKITGSP